MFPNNEILLMAYTILYTFLKLYTVNQKFKKKMFKERGGEFVIIKKFSVLLLSFWDIP